MKTLAITQLPNIEIAGEDLGRMSWDDAMKNCPNGWRLPTQQELMIIWASLTPKQREEYGFTASYYWSATEPNTITSWIVHFGIGYTTTSTKTSSTYYVRCVRDVINNTPKNDKKQALIESFRAYISQDIERRVKEFEESLDNL